jgi:hypothetical protein
MLYVPGSFSAHHQELIKLCAALGIVMLSCCLPLVWMGWNYSAEQFYKLLMVGGRPAQNVEH